MYSYDELIKEVTNNIYICRKLVIIINGNGKSGKDFLINSLIDRGLHILNESAIDPIKIILQSNGIWDGKKDQKGRQLLASTKTVFDEYNDFTTRYIINKFNSFVNEKNESIMFIHCGTLKQIRLFKKLFKQSCHVKSLYIDSLSTDTCTDDPRYINGEDADMHNYDLYFMNVYSTKDEDIKKNCDDFYKIIMDVCNERNTGCGD